MFCEMLCGKMCFVIMVSFLFWMLLFFVGINFSFVGDFLNWMFYFVGNICKYWDDNYEILLLMGSRWIKRIGLLS